jgi:hypothetical protein
VLTEPVRVTPFIAIEPLKLPPEYVIEPLASLEPVIVSVKPDKVKNDMPDEVAAVKEPDKA